MSQTIGRLEKWAALEPVHRGFEIRLGVRNGSRKWCVELWSLKDATVSRYGIVRGFGDTAEEARVAAFKEKWDRFHPEGDPFVDECIHQEPADITITSRDIS